MIRVGDVMFASARRKIERESANVSKQESSIDFPDPRKAQEAGLIAVGGRLDRPTLLLAYQLGIFPWPQEGYPLLWFSPEERGVLFFDEIHLPRSWKKLQTISTQYRFSKNEAFAEVIHACQTQKRKGQSGTWITDEVEKGYCDFHQAGYAHSFEVWREGQLIGGLYGVLVDGVFSGESMFHREDDASKRVLLWTVNSLQSEGLKWMDTQMVTSVVGALGARLIPRDEYLSLLRNTREGVKKRNRPAMDSGSKRRS